MKKRLVFLLCLMTLIVALLGMAVAAAPAGADISKDGSAQINYPDAASAILNYTDTTTYVQLNESVTGVVSVNGETAISNVIYLDLNGCNINELNVAEGYTVYCMDSETDDYAGAYGKITTISGEGTVAGMPWGKVSAKEANDEGRGYRAGYMMIEEATGTSFHRVYMDIWYVSLRSDITREGMYYTAIFAADQAVKDNVDVYGIGVSAQDVSTYEQWVAGMEDDTAPYTCLKSYYEMSTITAGRQNECNSTSLVNIMNVNNDNVTNTRNASTQIRGRAYMKTKDGAYYFGGTVSCSMQEVAQWADAEWNSLNNTKKVGFIGMYERFTSAMGGWTIPNVKGAYTTTDLIQQYRRNVAESEMRAMQTVLWTPAEDIHYSKDPNWNGEFGNHTDSNYIILKAGQVYRGLPYTHGSGSLDGFLTYATDKNANGVYTISDAGNEDLSGGANTNMANQVSRLGNDCSDAVYWAWAQVSSSITFQITEQMTLDYGCKPVGNYSIESGVTKNSEGKDVYTCDSTTGMDGTRSICAAQKGAIYEAYGMMKKGDAMVTYAYTDTGAVNGHAIMIVDIDPVNKTVTILEQGSSYERWQSLDNKVVSNAHNWGDHDTKPNGNCKQCSEAYTEQYIKETQNGVTYYKLDEIDKVVTFDELYASNYIPITCAELTTSKAPTRVKVATSIPGASLENIYKGVVRASYRIDNITLTIMDSKGDVVEKTTCIGGQASTGKQNGMYTFALNRFCIDYMNDVLNVYGKTDPIAVIGVGEATNRGTITAVNLEPGDYTYTYSCQLSNGKVVTFSTGAFTVNADGTYQ